MRARSLVCTGAATSAFDRLGVLRSALPAPGRDGAAAGQLLGAAVGDTEGEESIEGWLKQRGL